MTRLESIIKFAADLSTPCVVHDLALVEGHYRSLKKHMPLAHVYYAVKANPDLPVLATLRDCGSNFDIASPGELDMLTGLGVPADQISYGNTIKKSSDIAYAYHQGVRLFATDSVEDLQKIAYHAPGSNVFVRLTTEGSETADWPLSRKFGCSPQTAIDILLNARDIGLTPYGLSFHVGSQQHDIATWGTAMASAGSIFKHMQYEHGIELLMLNIGGGLPAKYLASVQPLHVYADEINRYLDETFPEVRPHIIIEPGRSLVADAGILITEVVHASRRTSTDMARWVYVDAGVFNGMIETLGEAIKYPLYCPQSGPTEPCVIAGPSCDSMDIMYEKHLYNLPLQLAENDRLYFFSAGAYTTSYASVGFNGFPPIRSYYTDSATAISP